jgi:predicted RND superfamily exporter protein
LAVWGVVALLASMGVARLRVDTSTDSVLDRSAPEWAYYQESLDRFGGDEIIVVALEGRDAFDPQLGDFVQGFSSELETVPGVRRVDSLSTVSLVHSSSDGTLELDPPLREGQSLASKRLQALVGQDRIAPRTIVSEDGRVLAVNLLLDDDSGEDYNAIIGSVHELLKGRPAWVSGVPVYRTETNARIVQEVALFVPLTLLVIAVVLFVGFRSLRAVAIPLVTAGLGTWVLCGVMGAVAVPLTISTMILPSVLLALGCAYVMHLLAAAPGCEDAASLREAFAPVALPIALSGLTTGIGFLAMCAIRIDAIRYVGALGAVGVLTLLLATLTVAPAALVRWPLPAKASALCDRLRERETAGVLRLAARRPWLVIAVWVVAFVGVTMGIMRLRVETDVTLWFERGTSVRDAYEAIRGRLSGITPMNFVIESESGESVTQPEVLSAIDGLASYLRGLPQVGKVLSIADPLRQLHGGFIDQADRPLPVGVDLVEQYLLLLESVPQIEDLITGDRGSANVLLRLDNNGSAYLLDVAQRAESWWRAHAPPGYTARMTGVMFEFARAGDEIAFGQMRGFGVALAAIAVVLLVILRSVQLAAIALVPNAAPVAIAFGTMGLAGIPLDAGTVLIGNLALGIAVDDTLHVVTGFHQERERGAAPRAAMHAALRRALPALVYTTAAVALGFGVLGLSEFTFIRNLGLVTAGLMLLCLAADLNLLPAVLLRGREKVVTPGGGALVA